MMRSLNCCSCLPTVVVCEQPIPLFCSQHTAGSEAKTMIHKRMRYNSEFNGKDCIILYICKVVNNFSSNTENE